MTIPGRLLLQHCNNLLYLKMHNHMFWGQHFFITISAAVQQNQAGFYYFLNKEFMLILFLFFLNFMFELILQGLIKIDY